MSFEFLAHDSLDIEAVRNWQTHASYLRRDVKNQKDLTDKRSAFLSRHAIEVDRPNGVHQKNHNTKSSDDGKGTAKSMRCLTQELDRAKLLRPEIDVAALPEFSAAITLRFQLLSPLLTRDDDPFYLFDNPVRKDHVFGVPHLAAASLKGLASDAMQRGFPGDVPWVELGEKDQERTMRYRLDQAMAGRLFGVASDDTNACFSQGGRVHFSPVWFSHVQLLVMNPTKEETGLGTFPIHFEAVAPVDDAGKPVKADISFYYFNPAGTEHADEVTARTDLACLVGALAAWWPALGLGAKRLAGYGAIEPISAVCCGTGYADMKKPLEFAGSDSWKKLAQRIARGQA